jgi:hypothetical protein
LEVGDEGLMAGRSSVPTLGPPATAWVRALRARRAGRWPGVRSLQLIDEELDVARRVGEVAR